MRVVEIGMKLISAKLRMRYNSENQFELKFWEDDAATEPSNLSAVASVFIEVYTDPLLPAVVWTGTVGGNGVTFDLQPSDTLVDWETRPFSLVLMKPLRNVVLSGEVVVQR